MFNSAYEESIEVMLNVGAHMHHETVVVGQVAPYDKKIVARLIEAEMINFEYPIIRVLTKDGEHYSPRDFMKSHLDDGYSFMEVREEPTHVGHRIVLYK